jgi:hypothetical protein
LAGNGEKFSDFGGIILTKKLGWGLLLLGSVLTLSGCGARGADSPATTTAKVVQVAGKTFQGTHAGSNTAADPRTVTTIEFAKAGTFTRQVKATHGVAKHVVSRGTWQQSKTSGKVTLKNTAVSAETFSDDAAAKEDKEPQQVVQRTRAGSGTAALLPAEAKTSKLTAAAKTLTDTGQHLKLKQHSAAVFDYRQHYTAAKAALTAAQNLAARHQFDHTTWTTTFAGTRKTLATLTFGDDGTYTRLSRTYYAGGDCYAQTDTGDFTFDPDGKALTLSKTDASAAYHYKSKDRLAANEYFESGPDFDTQGRMAATLTDANTMTFHYFNDGKATPASDEVMTKGTFVTVASPDDFAAQQTESQSNMPFTDPQQLGDFVVEHNAANGLEFEVYGLYPDPGGGQQPLDGIMAELDPPAGTVYGAWTRLVSEHDIYQVTVVTKDGQIYNRTSQGELANQWQESADLESSLRDY